MKKVVVLILVPIFFAQAGGLDDLLESVVLGAYYGEPQTIKTSRYSTFAGPSVAFRLRSDLLQKPVFSLQPPRFTASCAGLDFDAGWLTFMNLNTLRDMLSQAGSTLMWGVTLGMIYSLPGAAEAFDMLQKWGRYAQFLSYDLCRTGIEIGKGVGTALFERERSRAVSSEVGSGEPLVQAIKRIPQSMDVRRMILSVPYGIVYRATSDRDLADLIASATGILQVYPKDPTTGEVCKTADCAKNAQFVTDIRPPKVDDILSLLKPGVVEVKVYDCDWDPSWGYCRNITERELTTKSLTTYEYNMLSDIVSAVEGGSTLNNDQKRYIGTTPIPVSEIVNYALFLKKQGHDPAPLLYDAATLSASLKLRAFLSSVRANVSAYAYTYAGEKIGDTETINDLLSRLEESANALEEKIGQRVNMMKVHAESYEQLKRNMERVKAKMYKYIGVRRER